MAKNSTMDLKQEIKARRWGYEKIAPLDKIIEAIKKGAKADLEIAEHLKIDIKSLYHAIDHYRLKYGYKLNLNDYLVVFYPYFNIYKFKEE